MKRSNIMGKLNHGNLTVYKQRVAYHEAGHATAIHFNNRLKKLPSVHFEIIMEDLESKASDRPTSRTGLHDFIARVKGGRLIKGLPFMFDNGAGKSSASCDALVFRLTDGYRLAFEADIVNLLTGPLAEARYVALMDEEPFKYQLLTVKALKNYGGKDDLIIVNDYLQSYFTDEQEQQEWLNRLFFQAFEFVNDKANWKAISRLADYILASHKNEISSGEVAVVLENQIEAFVD